MDVGSLRPVDKAVVVVADDDVATRERIAGLLRNQGLTVVAANSGQKAIDAVRARPVDLVVLELNMPGLNGIDTCKVIKSITKDRFVPVVLLTPRGDMGARVLRTGADEQIPRWAEDGLLLDRLTNMLRVKRTHDDVEFAKNELSYDSVDHRLGDLPDHRGFHDRLQSEFEEAAAHLDPLACCIVAVDDFRELAAEHGPKLAALVLDEVAARVRAAVRPTDAVARFRTSEFGLLFPNTRPARALTLADGIVLEVAREPFTISGMALSLTVSIGLGLYPCGTIRTHSGLLDAASIAVARARVAGKNQICVVQKQGYIFRPTLTGAA